MLEQPKTLPQVRQELIDVTADVLRLEHEMTQVPEGPGYYDATRRLEAQLEELRATSHEAKKLLKTLQKQSQPSLFQ